MPEATPAEPVVEIAPVVETQPPAEQVVTPPPWGSDEEFDPQKAWELIQNLRAQKNDPKAAKELADLRKFRADAENANRTETERLELRAATAEQVAAEKDAELARTKAALKYHLSEEDAAALDGLPVDRIEAVAERLSSKPPAPAVPDITGLGAVGTPIGGPKQLTDADLERMTPAEIKAARKDGSLNKVLGRKP